MSIITCLKMVLIVTILVVAVSTTATRAAPPPPRPSPGHGAPAPAPAPALAPAPAPGSGGVPYALVVYQWPMGYCESMPLVCIPSVPLKFTLHGIWAMDGHDNQMNNCQGEAFSGSRLSGIRSQLQAIWPSIVQGKSDNVFWAEQWNKHGKCFHQLLLDYFTRAKDLTVTLRKMKSMDLLSALASSPQRIYVLIHLILINLLFV